MLNILESEISLTMEKKTQWPYVPGHFHDRLNLYVKSKQSDVMGWQEKRTNHKNHPIEGVFVFSILGKNGKNFGLKKKTPL